MPAQDKINLLPKDPFEEGFVGKFLKWALSIGRYIVIATELVVILAFLARFKLDRDLTNLNEALAQKKAILDSYGQLEADYRAVAERLNKIGQLDQQSLQVVGFLAELSAMTPLDVSFSLISIASDQVELQGTALSEQGLATFFNQIKKDDQLTNIAVGQVSSSGEKGPGIDFRLTAKRSEDGI